MLKKKVVLGYLITLPLPFPGFLLTVSSLPFSHTQNLVSLPSAPSFFAPPFRITLFFKICHNIWMQLSGTVSGEWGHDAIQTVHGHC